MPLPIQSRVLHWSDSLREPEPEGFLIVDRSGPVARPPRRELPRISVSPQTAAPLAEAIERVGLKFDRLEGLLEQAVAAIAELNRKISFSDKTTGGLMRQAQNIYGRPLGAIAPRTEAELWRQASDWSASDCCVIMGRFRAKRTAVSF
jgi:hypothetical protein